MSRGLVTSWLGIAVRCVREFVVFSVFGSDWQVCGSTGVFADECLTPVFAFVRHPTINSI